MAWPVPEFERLPVFRKPSPWPPIVGSLLIVFGAAVSIFYLWLKIHGRSGGLGFWLCLIGIPLIAGLLFWCAVGHCAAMRLFGVDSVKYYASAVLSAWQHWSRQYVVLGGFSVILVEDALAEKIAGLSGTVPENKSEVRRLEQIKDDFKSSRTEQILERLLEGVEVALTSSGIDHALRIVAWAGEHADGVAIEDCVKKLWSASGLHLVASVEVVSALNWSMIERHVLGDGVPLLVLTMQIHDDAGKLAQFTESAAALVFLPQLARTDTGEPVVRIYRSIPTSTATMIADFNQLGDYGALPLAQIRSGWNCNLGKAEGYGLARAVGDCGLVFEGGTTGMINIGDFIGPTGPISPWLSLALAAELVQYGQGPQLLATQEGKHARLCIAAADEAVPVERGGKPPSSGQHGSTILACALPTLTLLLGLLFKAADLFPWVSMGVAGAVVLALSLRLLHPYLVQARAIELVHALGGRLPPAE
ncbi:hypothetical protein [Caballeronia sp. TF1N1]|uniref:hypothetical protein n=1 Tax=Caballeronia sp. TF1N1 TaxID=2878153 RepID=UPI001FD59AAA|nr:hypothetical protein [Caballeronia sp. TF1N1]